MFSCTFNENQKDFFAALMFEVLKRKPEPKNETEWFEKFAAEFFEEMSKITKTSYDLKAKSHNGKLSPLAVFYLIHLGQLYTPKRAFDKYLAIEGDKAVLKQELKLILKKFYEFQYGLLNFGAAFNFQNEVELTDLFKKYKMCFCCDNNTPTTPTQCAEEMNNKNFKNEIYKNVCEYVELTFPDLTYTLAKKFPIYAYDAYELLAKGYKNFPVVLSNVGLLGMLPKGKKYGGLVKVLLHRTFALNRIVVSMEAALAYCLNLYGNGFLEHDKRAAWFEKLQISMEDCAAWSKSFDEQFPDYADAHKFFEQIA